MNRRLFSENFKLQNLEISPVSSKVKYCLILCELLFFVLQHHCFKVVLRVKGHSVKATQLQGQFEGYVCGGKSIQSQVPHNWISSSKPCFTISLSLKANSRDFTTKASVKVLPSHLWNLFAWVTKKKKKKLPKLSPSCTFNRNLYLQSDNLFCFGHKYSSLVRFRRAF